MFVTAKYSRTTKPNDAMYVWLENVDYRGFEVCIREFLPFGGKHQDTIVVGIAKNISLTDFYFEEKRESQLNATAIL